MKFIDLHRQYDVLEQDIQSQIQRVLEHGQFIMGEEVFELERQLASYTEAKHCVTVNSGTDALIIALRCLGIGEGDEVILPAFSFFSSVEAIVLVGATPLFADIDPETYTLCPERVKEKLSPHTKAIMPVDLYGQCADYEALQAIADEHDIALVDDAAQSFGATYKQRQVGTLATISCTSFFPSKPLGAYGDGGACFTHDNDLAEIMRQIRDHGQHNKYQHVRLGFNSRLDTLQAAILLAKLKIFPQELKSRQKAAAYYDKHLEGKVVTPHLRPDCTSTYAQYTIQVNNRDMVQEHLRNAGVPSTVHYPAPLNWQPYYKNDPVSQERYPASIQASRHVLSLPMHPYITHKDQDVVIKELLDAIEPSC